MKSRILVIALLMVLAPSALALSRPFNPTCLKDCKVDSLGYSTIRSFEGLRLFPYADAVGIQTVGFGHVIRKTDTLSFPLTGPQAQMLLENDVKPTEKAINTMVKVPFHPRQTDAIADFTFNLGTNTLKKSTLLRKINGNSGGVDEQFERYSYAGHNQLRGLLMRRRLEARIYDGD